MEIVGSIFKKHSFNLKCLSQIKFNIKLDIQSSLSLQQALYYAFKVPVNTNLITVGAAATAAPSGPFKYDVSIKWTVLDPLPLLLSEKVSIAKAPRKIVSNLLY